MRLDVEHRGDMSVVAARLVQSSRDNLPQLIAAEIASHVHRIDRGPERITGSRTIRAYKPSITE